MLLLAFFPECSMPTANEKQAFSKRLILALRRASPNPVEGATQLANGLSQHYADGVSVQTAHKWLTGRTIPSAEKTAILAKWLNVNEHWLRYGPAKSVAHKPRSNAPAMPTTEAMKLAQQIQALRPHSRYLVEELVGQLVELEYQ
jgi:transcriptional regulator with XRE-family HTH domain